tara:strand:+ start:329 stop:610 length:282 start_codon:yes stop_codon:yes gene_type:complete
LKGNKPLDRDYFKYKNKDRPKKKEKVTPCCGQDIDHEGMNVNNEYDWKLIEEYIEKALTEYSSTETITPVACKKCGRFLRYSSVLKQDKKYWR